MVRIPGTNEQSREMEVARQVARNLHEFTRRDFIITFLLDTLCEGLVVSPVDCLNNLIQRGIVERAGNGSFRVVSVTKGNCGRLGCIILYTSGHCIWCESMKKLLSETLQKFGFSKEIIFEIDVDKQESQGISSLPTIDCCFKRLVGLQDEESVVSEVLGAAIRPCFSRTRSSKF